MRGRFGQNVSLGDPIAWEAVGWGLLIGLVFWLTYDFDAPLPHYPPGAAMWPRIIQTSMAIAAVVLFISRFMPQTFREDARHAPNYLEEIPDNLVGVTWRTVGVFLIPLLWTYAMHKMGFLLITPFFLIAFTWLMGVRHWRSLLVFAIGFYVTLVFVFYKLIFTPLPMGAGIFHTINSEIIAVFQ